ncbi:IST1 homolog [Biomphalaria glabrata]|uniref:IST1 homolog n=1 Tax=Biomphalaria glabrata TaxID=6526 RepID=A0A9W3AQQ9_BIOGL|nr:IST1 homolog [Biomphalaria glabrata]
MFKSGPNYTKLKTNLRLIINRLKLLEKKKTEMALKSRKEIADYISAGKEDRARIRVEHIIREDYLVEAMELLEMYCDLLLARFGLIQTQKELDPGLEEAIASIIWATPRLQADVQELKAVSEEFARKYSPDFAQACRGNSLSNVNEKVMHKLSVQAPPKSLVERYMVEIAKTYNVPFEPDPSIMHQDEILLAENLLIDLGTDDKKNTGGSGGPKGGMGVPQPLNYPMSPSGPMHFPPAPIGGGGAPPPLPSQAPHGGFSAYTPNQPPAYNSGAHSAPPGPPNFDQLYSNTTKPPYPTAPSVSVPPARPHQSKEDVFPELPTVPSNTLPDLGNSVGGNSGEDVDFDDLTRRFEQLKKKK